MRYQDIDWSRMWRDSRRHKSWKSKKSKAWDQRAASFARRNLDSSYARLFLERMRPEPGWSVLDVGSGPGTLAIPLARQVRRVTAMDFSARMLEQLHQAAADEGLANITTIKAAWEDDWGSFNLPPHDVAVASRSLAVDDPAAALAKLNDRATKKVFISDRVGTGPFDPAIFEAVGRPFEPGPDYIFTVNILYGMGIHAHVDFIQPDQQRCYATPEEALDSCAWMLDNITGEETARLKAHVDSRLQQNSDGSWALAKQAQPKWALIWWDKS